MTELSPTLRHKLDKGRPNIEFANAVLGIAFVGFPLAASASQILGLQTSDLNVLYRALYAASCVILTIWSLSLGRYKFDFVVTFFLFFYSIRLILDYGAGVYPNLIVHSQYFLATVLVPAIAMGGGRNWYNEKICTKWVIIAGGIGAALIAYNNATASIDYFLLEAREGRAWLDFINPISIGYHGVIVLAAAMIYFLKYANGIWRPILLVIAVLGAYLIVISGSRGPVVALGLALLITGGANRNARAAHVVAACIGLIAFVSLGAPEIILERFETLGTDQSSSDRLIYLEQATRQFLDHPLAGVAYIEPVTGQYPHNLLVEAAMALGISGFLLMLWMQVSVVSESWRCARGGEWWLPFIGCVMLANAWISGSIWGSGPFFMLIWLLRERPPASEKLGAKKARRLA